MKKLQKIPLAWILTICLIFVYIPAFADDPNGPGFGTPDSNPPVLHSFSVDKNELNAPGVITITAEADDDVSGINNISGSFRNLANERYYFFSISQSDLNQGKYISSFDISPHEVSGLFELMYVDLTDIAHNSVTYYPPSRANQAGGERILDQDVTFYIYNTDSEQDINVHFFGINTPDLENKIAALPDGSTAKISFGCLSKLSAKVFDCIQGTNKKIILEGKGIQWIFEGKDIFSPKNVNLFVEISGYQDQFLIGDSFAYLLEFADNGQLPGKAKIRLKADATMKNDIGQSNVYVYYYDKQNEKLVNIASDITVISDSYFEFEITHCSDYVITKGPAKNPSGSTDPEPEPDPEPDPDPNPIPSPNPTPNHSTNSSGSGGGGGGGRSSSSSSKSSNPLLNPKQTINALLGKTGLAPGTTTPSYGTIDLDRSANDLTMAYIASLNLPREQMAAYYVEHYTELYQQFRNELQTAMK